MSKWVLLHGTPLSPQIWRQVADQLTDQPVITPDCTVVPAVGGQAQEALARQVLDEIDSDELDVVGHSFGGQIAIEMALAEPDRLRSLTILCSRDTAYPAFADLAVQVRHGSPPAVEVSIARWFTTDEVAADLPAVAQARADLEAASLSSWAAALDAIAHYDQHVETARLDLPVVVLAAGHDGVSTPEVMREMADRIPGAHFHVEPEWAHMSAFADPAALARLLTDQLDTARRGE